MTESSARAELDLSVVLPTLNERENLEELIPQLQDSISRLGVRSEIVVVDSCSADGTAAAASRLGATVIERPARYGEALLAGFAAARGAYILTMDADHSHDPAMIAELWAHRAETRIAIASRYVRRGSAKMPWLRTVLSRSLNAVYSRGLALGVRDVSSGYRIYPARALRKLELRAKDFDVLPEILVRAYANGWQIMEVPFAYRPRHRGSSKARLLRLGNAYAGTFAKLWKLRNSIESADYDERAFDSLIPLQRAWQRRRHAVITRRATGSGLLLDLGCGSSRILRDLQRAIGLDISFTKLRYMRRYGLPLVNGDIFALPFRDATFDDIVCSEVIEHIPAGAGPFAEMARIQRPGGRLILGTPDYGRWSWRALESLYRAIAPGGYADEHITQYRHEELRDLAVRHGYRHLATDYVFGSEMILSFERSPS